MKNAEVTRERILEAATAEFATYGIAGARVDRIAKASAGNKNLIYIYFGSKEQLFEAVMERHLQQVYDQVPFTPADLPGYAVRMFDFKMANPQLMRLASWFNLEQQNMRLTKRDVNFGAKLKELAQAQADGLVNPNLTPAFLMTFITGMSSAWTAASTVGHSVDPTNPAEIAALREAIAKSVAQISQV